MGGPNGCHTPHTHSVIQTCDTTFKHGFQTIIMSSNTSVNITCGNPALEIFNNVFKSNPDSQQDALAVLFSYILAHSKVIDSTTEHKILKKEVQTQTESSHTEFLKKKKKRQRRKRKRNGKNLDSNESTKKETSL